MKDEKKYFVFSLCAITIIGVLFYIFIHLKKVEEIKYTEEQIIKINNEIHSINQFINKHKDMDENITNLADRHFRVSLMFGQNLMEEEIARFLTESIAENHLEILMIDGKNSTSAEKYFVKVFNISVKGDYFHILDFIQELYNAYYFFDIRNMTIKNNNGILTLDLEINYYFSPNTK